MGWKLETGDMKHETAPKQDLSHYVTSTIPKPSRLCEEKFRVFSCLVCVHKIEISVIGS